MKRVSENEISLLLKDRDEWANKFDDMDDLLYTAQSLAKEVQSWRERCPVAGFDGQSVVLSG